jgi:hypothetical protein
MMMDALGELKNSLAAIAVRSAAIKSVCSNEESTKQFLVLPVLGALGYDYTDPRVVQPEYSAGFRPEVSERVDYAIMWNGEPVIAIECKKIGADLTVNRGQLRAYFTALRSVRLGVLTDGLRYELFADCEDANIMDAEPFATLDLEAAVHGSIPDDVLEAFYKITRANFQPGAVAETAEMMLAAKRLRTIFVQEIKEPSEDFCRYMLQRVGIKRVRRSSIQARYSELVRTAFEEALVLPVLETLRSAPSHEPVEPAPEQGRTRRILTTDRELAVYRYVCRRLAYLASDEWQFSAIERVYHRDYVGKFAVYYENVRKGRLFDFIEGDNGYDKFIFPEPFGEIMTNAMADIDEPLRATFTRRVRELNSERTPHEQALQRA